MPPQRVRNLVSGWRTLFHSRVCLPDVACVFGAGDKLLSALPYKRVYARLKTLLSERARKDASQSERLGNARGKAARFTDT
ncbi:MAG: hypothetical protein RIE06_01075 [Roseibium album]|uniref:hypothetical protein n=1 Tax=Roseibium album TaxID=311410 RepID=UPI0032ED7F31